MPTLEIMEATMSGIVSAKFPSVTALALSLVTSILLLALIRTAFTRLVTISDITNDNANTDADEKGAHTSYYPNHNQAQDARSSKYGALSSWSWSWSWRWEGLPVALPVSLAISEKDCPGVGVGMGVAAAIQQQQQQERDQQRQPPKMTWQKHRRSPGFEQPCKQPWMIV
jgi:hypothetical protein